jgi:hypothetical protein
MTVVPSSWSAGSLLLTETLEQNFLPHKLAKEA